MKAVLLLVLVSLPAAAVCDWHILSDRKDPMTDQRICLIDSPSAKLGFGVYPDRVVFLTHSAYRYRDGLTVRVDDAHAVYMPDDQRATNPAPRNVANTIYPQILAGQRIRVSYRNYPYPAEGDAEICNLPALIQSCQSVPAHSSR